MTVWTELARILDDAAAPKEQTRWSSPGQLASALDARTVTTPALDLIDQALVDLAGTPDGRLIVTMPPQEGKLVADDEPVPTPGGWTRHGDLRAGDHVFHPDGHPVRVVEVHDPAEASLRVTFSDHTSVTVHPRHEWTLHDRTTGTVRTVETATLAAGRLTYGTRGQRGSRHRWQLPHRAAVRLPDADLPIDAYTLGVWLGDGSSTKGCVTHHPDDVYDLPYPQGSTAVHADTGIHSTYYLGLRTDLRRAGLIDRKHIPAAYLRGSETQRRDLLAGLIDTDGHASASGQVSFDNADRDLVDQVAELARTLGYRAHVHTATPPKLSSSGIQGVQEMHRVTFTPHDRSPARLPRKAAKVGIRRRVAVVAVEPVTPRSGRCITVNSPDGLYLVGRGWTPTHNSQRVSRRFPLWALTQDPDLRVAIVSYEHGVARRWGRATRDDVTQNPDVVRLSVRGDVSAQNEWQIDTCGRCWTGEGPPPAGQHKPGHDGGVYTTGVGGALTGRPVDLLIIDDPIKDRLQADSELYRQRVWDWWTDVASTRLAPGAQVVLVLTRWHHDDLAGRLLAAEDGHLWRVLNIAAQAEDDPEAPDPLGRPPGAFMDSTRGRTLPQWEAIKVRVGSRTWAALYQGRPTPDAGNLFPADGWARYTVCPWVERGDGTRIVPEVGRDPDTELVQSWDFTFKDTSSSDYVVGQIWLRRGVHAYLLDQVRRRAGFTESVQMMLDLTARWPQAAAKLVEDKANGPAILNALRSRVGGLIPVEPEGSKYARAAAVTPFVEAKNVLLPDATKVEGTAWVSDLTEEARDFPAAVNDDTVDAMSQAVHRLLLVPLVGDEDVHEWTELLDDEDDGALSWRPAY